MNKEISVCFPGGKRVDANVGEFTVKTDQSVDHGGQGTAPSPFDVFLASLGTCAGFYVQEFCSTREISTDGLSVELNALWNSEKKLYANIEIKIRLPISFPEKYRKAIVRVVDKCAVKRHITNTLEFETIAV